MVEKQVSPQKRWQFGAHSLREVAPDTLHLELVGLVEGDELQQIVETENAWGLDKPQWFIIGDLSRLGGSTPASRAYMAEIPPNPHSISIVYGTSFAMRILVDMMMRARRLLSRAEPDAFVIVATEADAWAEVERRRQRHAAQNRKT